MKKNKEKFETIISISCGIFLLLFSIFKEKYVATIVLSTIYLATFLFIFFINNSTKKFEKRNHDFYISIKDKKVKNVYDEIYLLAYHDKLNDEIKNYFDKKNLKNIKNIVAYITEIKKIIINFSYQDFDVLINIDDENINYSISPPSRFEIINNKSFSQIRNTDYLMKNYFFIDDFYNDLSIISGDALEEIKTYIESNHVDSVFNGRLLLKIEDYRNHLKLEGLPLIILSLIFMSLMGLGFVMSFIDKSYKEENLFGYVLVLILCPCLIIISLCALMYGIKNLVMVKNCAKDIELKRITKIKSKPLKIKVNKFKAGRYNPDIMIRSIKLIYQDKVLVIPVSNSILKKRYSINKFCEECLNIETELSYLSTSYIVVKGEEKYLKLLKKHLI